MPHGLVVNSTRLTPRGAYLGKVLDVDYIKLFRYVYYLFISPKSWPVNTTSKKFLDRGREYVFVRHSEETTSQY
jgi:hypothetical protein